MKLKTRYIGLLILGFFMGVFITGAISGAKAVINGDKADAIKSVLANECKCESVNQFMYSKGIQFSKEDGLSTEKVEYELVSCQYQELYKEVARINKALVAQVEGYEDIDLLKLEFVGSEKHETVIIKNGVIQ